MESYILTPKNKKQAERLKAFADELKINIGVLSDDDKEDAGLLKAMKEGEKDKRKVSLQTFFKNLKGERKS